MCFLGIPVTPGNVRNDSIMSAILLPSHSDSQGKLNIRSMFELLTLSDILIETTA